MAHTCFGSVPPSRVIHSSKGPFSLERITRPHLTAFLRPDGGEGWKSAKQAYNGAEMELSGVNSTGDTVTWDKSALEAAGKTGLVVDVMGTWCPNCMDEARLLPSWLQVTLTCSL